jgi:hypothetical protein
MGVMGTQQEMTGTGFVRREGLTDSWGYLCMGILVHGEFERSKETKAGRNASPSTNRAAQQKRVQKQERLCGKGGNRQKVC